MESDLEVSLHGNAAGGLLGELFALDVTVATLTYEECGAIAPVAEAKVYGGPMGAILRCSICGTAVLRLVRSPAG